MPTAPDSNGLPRYVESDSGPDGTFSGLLNLALGWISTLLGAIFLRLPRGGVLAVTTNSSGYLTVAHGLGRTPVTAYAQIRNDTPASLGPHLHATTSNYTSTTFRVYIYRNDSGSVNAPYGDNLVTFSWSAF